MHFASSATEIPSLRFAEPGDTAGLVSLINSAFNPVECSFVEGDRVSPDDVSRYMERGRYLIAELADVLVACIYIELRGDRAYLGMLSVAPQSQNSGLGRRVMNAAEDYCGANGCSAADIRVINRRTELVAIYRGFGYVETGTEPVPAYALDRFKMPCHFITMSKSLIAE
jgi:GNAT superfamily N-acetyltransferase